MKKTFGSAFALIMVALFTVAPTSPATATGAIHLYMAGKVGQKAVGTTIMAGTAGFSSSILVGAGPRVVPSFPLPACVYLDAGDGSGPGTAIDPFDAHAVSQCLVSGDGNPVYRSGAGFTIPASGNSYFEIPLPELAEGSYLLSFTALNSQGPASGDALTLQWIFSIAKDGTFSSISVF